MNTSINCRLRPGTVFRRLLAPHRIRPTPVECGGIPRKCTEKNAARIALISKRYPASVIASFLSKLWNVPWKIVNFTFGRVNQTGKTPIAVLIFCGITHPTRSDSSDPTLDRRRKNKTRCLLVCVNGGSSSSQQH